MVLWQQRKKTKNAKNKEHKTKKNANGNDDDAFIMFNKTHSTSMYKWIMNSGATKHMTSHRVAFDIYE